MPVVPPETLQELTALRQRVEYLEAENALLRDLDSARIKAVMDAYGITVVQARTLIALARGGVLTRDIAVGLELNRVRDADPRSLDSCVKRLRQALPWLKIKSLYGLGYELEPEALKAVRQVIQQAGAGA